MLTTIKNRVSWSTLNRCFLLLALLMTLGVRLPQAQAAARTATIVRGIGAGSDKAAALVGHYVREIMSRDEHYEVVDISLMLGNTDRNKAVHTFQTAEELVHSARDAYDRLDLDAAQNSLEIALQNYESGAAYVADFQKVAEAHLLLGAVHILKGEDRIGFQQLQYALNISPQAEPDPRIFNPAMRAQFQKVATRLSAQPTGALNLTSSPGYTEVYVDGVFSGVTPVILENVTEGRHYVRMVQDGLRPWGKVLNVVGRREISETAALHTSRRFDAFDQEADVLTRLVATPKTDPIGQKNVLNSAKRMATLTGAESVLAVQVRLDGERVLILANQIHVGTQEISRMANYTFSYDNMLSTYAHEVAAMLHTSFGTDAAEPRVAPVARERRPTKRVAGSKTTALPYAGESGTCWGGHVSCRKAKYSVTGTMLGIGVAGVIAGGIEWGLARQTHNKWRQLAQTDPAQAQMRSKGRRQALLGDVFMFTGGALVVASAITFFAWEPTPSVADVLNTQNRNEPQARNTQPVPVLKLKPQAIVAQTLPGGGYINAAFTF